MNPYVSELSLFDIAGTEGVAADISHINTKAIAKVPICHIDDTHKTCLCLVCLYGAESLHQIAE